MFRMLGGIFALRRLSYSVAGRGVCQKTQAKHQPSGLWKFGCRCLGTACSRDLLLTNLAQLLPGMPTWKHGQTQKDRSLC